MPKADNPPIDPITLEILWTRLIAIADETATILKRTSFSPTVRESNDYSCVLFDENGDTVAENTIGIPSFNGVMSRALKRILQQYPQEQWLPGDVVITNDPWIASGHLLDITCVIPIYHQGKLVGFTGSIAHMADMGGSGWAADAGVVYEEGINIPPSFLYREGKPNEDLIRIIRANVRVPDEVLGDIHAQIAAGRAGAALLVELLEEHGIADISPISQQIQAKAEKAMRRAVAAIPDGVYRHEMETDGYDGQAILLKVAVTVAGDEMKIDFTGSSPQIGHAINVPYNYTHAYTCFPVKCAIDPLTPRNEGSYRPLSVIAPTGSILNPEFPAPVNGRHLVGHFLSCVVYGALAKAIPDRIIADSGSAPQQYTIFNGTWKGRPFTTILTICGGMGARPSDDGLSCTSFPSNVSVGSMEITEAVSPIIVWKKELLQNSGGAGRFRGGLGQIVDLEIRADGPVQMSLMFDRVEHPASGTAGGQAGGAANAVVNGKQAAFLKGRDHVLPGDRITLQYSGGGGFGSPKERELEHIESDLRNELISKEAAVDVYGYEV
ncbi:hydantoinase B/oxoprolinase family protein [Paenibacillus sp. MBLB4367]|uniref:hydantoinase B/oxoprolinase family protein n=1 Tax=Paenibacillus sp. MBLB4367 TaxID=3384767 RepID=UPI003908251B